MLRLSQRCMSKSTDSITAPSYMYSAKDTVKAASFFGYMRFFAEFIAYCFYYCYYYTFVKLAGGLDSQMNAA